MRISVLALVLWMSLALVANAAGSITEYPEAVSSEGAVLVDLYVRHESVYEDLMVTSHSHGDSGEHLPVIPSGRVLGARVVIYSFAFLADDSIPCHYRWTVSAEEANLEQLQLLIGSADLGEIEGSEVWKDVEPRDNLKVTYAPPEGSLAMELWLRPFPSGGRTSSEWRMLQWAQSSGARLEREYTSRGVLDVVAEARAQIAQRVPLLGILPLAVPTEELPAHFLGDDEAELCMSELPARLEGESVFWPFLRGDYLPEAEEDPALQSDTAEATP